MDNSIGKEVRCRENVYEGQTVTPEEPTMYVYRGVDSKEGQEILGRHMREMEDESLWFKPEKINEPHVEAVIDWFIDSPLYTYWKRHMEETGDY